MSIPCPTHSPEAWVLYKSWHPGRAPWVSDAKIARNCCPDCSSQAAPGPAIATGESK